MTPDSVHRALCELVFENDKTVDKKKRILPGSWSFPWLVTNLQSVKIIHIDGQIGAETY